MKERISCVAYPSLPKPCAFGATALSGDVIYLNEHEFNRNGYLYTATGILTCCVLGYTSSLATGRPRSDSNGLTIHTLAGKET